MGTCRSSLYAAFPGRLVFDGPGRRRMLCLGSHGSVPMNVLGSDTLPKLLMAFPSVRSTHGPCVVSNAKISAIQPFHTEASTFTNECVQGGDKLEPCWCSPAPEIDGL